jgi:antitoxin YefM
LEANERISDIDLLVFYYHTYVQNYVQVRGYEMKSISYTSARSSLAKTMEKVCEDHAPIAITRKGEGAVVMMSMADYQALEETAYLLRSPKNMRRLIQSVSELEDGMGKEKELIE